MQKEVVVVSGARTAIGAFGGSLKDTPVVERGAQAGGIEAEVGWRIAWLWP